MTDLVLEQPASGALSGRPRVGLPTARAAATALARFGVIFTLFSLVTVLIFWPGIAHLHSALIGPPEDNMQDFWNTWYAAVGRSPAHFFVTNLLRFPEGTPLTYQSFAYPQVFAVVVLSRVFGTDIGTLVALQNLTLLASFPLAGLGAFYLVRHLVGSTAGALLGGFVFAFNPSHVAQALHHAHVSSIEFLPFFVLAYLLALERRSAVWLGSAAVFYALSALSCWYYLFYGAYFMAFQLLYERVRQQTWPRGWLLLAPLLCLSSTICLLMPLIAPMAAAARPSLYVGGGNTAVADLLAFVTFPPEHLLSSLSHGLYARFSGYPWESTVYLGLINLAVLTWRCLRTGLARDSLNFYILLGMLTFGLLASGEALHVAGAVTFLHLPDVVLDKLPFFANVRTPSRAIVFVYLFMSIGIGSAAAGIWRKGSLASRGALAALATLIVIDFFPFHLQTTPVARSPGLSLLRTDREQGFGVLSLPIGYVEENDYMLEQIYHGRPIMDGNTTRQMTVSLVNRLSLANLPRQRQQLVRAHVKYILLHHPTNGLYAWSEGLAPVAEFLRTYHSVYRDRQLTVLRVY